MRILAADDDIVTQSLLEELLGQFGYSVSVCNDGQEAWELFRHEPFKLVITDWMMPHLDGLTLCHRIRKLKLPHYVYIIILTSKDQKDHTVRGLDAGADDFMCKPIDVDELHARIRTGVRILQYDDELTRTSHKLVQSAKLAAVGQLAAGIAHEINTPIQFVSDNATFLRDALKGMEQFLMTCRKTIATPEATSNIQLLHAMKSMAEEIDLEFLLAEIPGAIQQTLEGVDRVGHIVRSMKEFSHPGSDNKESTDINRAIDNTIEVTRNEWKYVANIITNFSRDLPEVHCYSADIKQVILNLLVNASHAIREVVGERPSTKGTITITTSRCTNSVEIRVKDTGCGIPPDMQSRIFEPFYTTKEVGKGTGQGLAISHTIIAEKHSGTITFESHEGHGTEFVIRLPLKIYKE